jgi:8-oxoguanine deaminase
MSPATLIEHLERLVPMGGDAEIADAYLVIEDDKISAVGSGQPPQQWRDGTVIDGRGLIALPGLINTHHHFFQTLTRALPAAQNVRILDWMEASYPFWARIDAEAVYATARVALAELMLSGCSTSSDHLYAFPAGAGSPIDMLGAEIDAARRLGVRFHATRGAVDISLRAGGSPPPELVEDTDEVLASMAEVIARFHDPKPGAMIRIGLAPNSLTICSERLMRESGELARKHGVTRHTHVAEVLEEEEYCLREYGQRPIERLAELGWVADDVWLAHVVYANQAEVELLARAGAGVAHCPVSNMRLASGAAPILDMLANGVAVGLGVDGSASNDSGNLLAEARQALLVSRLRERDSGRLMTARQALRMATEGGARILKRDDIGSLRPGKQADVALFRLAGVAGAGFENDPVAGLLLASTPRAEHLIVNGRFAVRDYRLVNDDEADIVGQHRQIVARIVQAK